MVLGGGHWGERRPVKEGRKRGCVPGAAFLHAVPTVPWPFASRRAWRLATWGGLPKARPHKYLVSARWCSGAG